MDKTDMALFASFAAFVIASATAILDLWVWVKIAKMCRKADKEIDNG